MGKTILVIGAAGGIGLAVTKLLAESGYDVVGTVLDGGERGLVERDIPGVARLLTVDMGSAEKTRTTLSDFLAEGHELEGAVVCAGINPNGPLELAPLDEVRRTLEINTVSCLAVYQAVLPALRKTRGSLVLITSMAGKVGMPFIGIYTTSKFALEGMADVMRREAFPWGVRVTVVEPGGIMTPIGWNQIPKVEARMQALTGDARDNYAGYFQAYIDRLNTNLPNGLPASAVATQILEILRNTEPEARYTVGADAATLCAQSRSMSDLEMDEKFRASYGAPLQRRG